MRSLRFLLVVFVVAALVVSTGCAARKTVQPEAQPVDEGIGQVEETTASAAMRYVVRKGDTLWDISGKSGIYGDSFQWPLLFRANRDQIQDPDWIEIGQQFDVRKDFTRAEVADAVQKAKDTPPYVPRSAPRKTLPLKY